MDSPPLAPQILLSPFYSNDSLTHSRPHNLVAAQSNDSQQSSPVQPSISNSRPLAQRISVFLYLSLCLEFMLMDDDDAKGRE